MRQPYRQCLHKNSASNIPTAHPKNKVMTSVCKRLTIRNKRREGIKDISAFLLWATKREVLVLMKTKKKKKKGKKIITLRKVWVYDKFGFTNTDFDRPASKSVVLQELLCLPHHHALNKRPPCTDSIAPWSFSRLCFLVLSAYHFQFLPWVWYFFFTSPSGLAILNPILLPMILTGSGLQVFFALFLQQGQCHVCLLRLQPRHSSGR